MGRCVAGRTVAGWEFCSCTNDDESSSRKQMAGRATKGHSRQQADTGVPSQVMSSDPMAPAAYRGP